VIYDEAIRDHKPFGLLTFTDALTYSSNVCYARVADKLGKDRLYNSTRDFGLGARSGVRLPGEEVGIVHPVDKWSGRTLVTMAIGQEVSATFLQMVMAFAAIANDGVLVEPRIHVKVVAPDGRGEEPRKVKVVRQVVPKAVALRVRRMLKHVVERGTARRAAISSVEIGGKTGTSQKFDKETQSYSNERVWASFIGLAPVDDPVLVCGVLIDEPAGALPGGAAAAPAFRKVLEQIISDPELEYAGRMLSPGNPSDTAARPTGVPEVCGMSRTQAAEVLHTLDIDCEIIGSGDTIRHQSPAPGEMLGHNARLIAYTSGTDRDRRGKGTVRVPNCVGKDLRDAVNAVNLKGLVPHVLGAGRVDRQTPTVGAVVEAAATCTLYCSFDG
jgi:membrane peptidoglycan carboxypeptidase